MLAITGLLIVAVSLLLTYLAITTIYRRRRRGEPPIAGGHLVWGSATEFSSNAVSYLHKCRDRLGDVFTLRLVNQYLTIIMDPHSYEAVSREKNFDFDAIQKQVNWNVFSFVLKEPRVMIKNTGRTVRGSFLNGAMDKFVGHLDTACDDLQPVRDVPPEWVEYGLREMCSMTMFDALFHSVFGRRNHPMFNPQRVYKNFEEFHRYFNYFWLGMPKKWFPSAMQALGELLEQPTSQELLECDDSSSYIKTAVEYMKMQGQSEGDIKGHNLVYLHVNYNTFRLSFWVLYYLLAHPEALAGLREELDAAIEQNLNESTNTASFNVKDLEELKVLDSVITESSRLSSGVFMVRYIADDTQFTDSSGNKHLMRKGDRVAIYPPAIHKDPEIFDEPLKYKYDRFVDTKFYKDGREVKNPVMAFGTICPGKRFALLQSKWFLMKMMTHYDMELIPGESTELDVEYHGHEILPPKNDVQIRMKNRPDAPQLEFVV